MRFIQVGVGGFGAGWLRLMHRDGAVSLAAVVDTDDEALNAAASATGLGPDRCFADYRDAFESVDADAVLCVTPPDVHRQVATAAFGRGLHVLTEKPLADTMEAARGMVEAAEAAGRKLMVSQNYRFRAWVRTMRQLVGGGEFGRPDNAMVNFARSPRFEGSFRLKMEHPLVRDMSIHHFDLMRAITGLEPVSVFATTWRPSWSWFSHDPCVAAVFEFARGLKVLYRGSWVARGPETSWEGDWYVECEQAMLQLREGKVHFVPADHPQHEGEVELSELPCENQQFSLLEFRRAVAEDREPETSGRDNLNSLAMVFAATESARRRQPVTIEEVLAT